MPKKYERRQALFGAATAQNQRKEHVIQELRVLGIFKVKGLHLEDANYYDLRLALMIQKVKEV
ncbi:hypothetical protein [Kurthia huakuii]|uniref:hypothetical protein n=1 Tax=Kurthia huakuii TaxID=1421019 RepID=UPI000495185F|nr:hypothetical protein [Kurthia huakuii]MBM7698660.1 preprotein translocase subunit SecB [Kurthia huakuii]